MNKLSETMVDILLRDLDSVVRCGAIQSRNQVTLLTSFLHFSCHEDEEDFVRALSITSYVGYILDLNVIMLNCIAHFLPLLSVK